MADLSVHINRDHVNEKQEVSSFCAFSESLHTSLKSRDVVVEYANWYTK